MNDKNPQSNADKASDKALSVLKKEYVVIGRRRIHSFYGWLIIGLVAGAAAGIIFVVRNGYSQQSSASTPVQFPPTTTLTAETTDNTATATTFPGCETSTVTSGKCVNNGDLVAGNISKVNVHTLLPASHASAKIYTTYIPYWGNSSHPDIGYSSTDPVQVAKEVADLSSRGFDGIVIDWYGPGSWEEEGTEVMKSALDAQKSTNLTFSLMIDQGALYWHSCYPGCSATQALLNTIAFATGQGYFTDSHYQTLNGKPLVHEFGLEAYSIDWASIESAYPNLQFVWENPSGFTDSDSVGAFGWPQPIIYTSEPAEYNGVNYLTSYYSTALKYQSEYVVGATWKGFDDTVASWSPAPYDIAGVNGGRRIEQNCAETWLDTWAALASYSGNLSAVEATTWQDYEEGTEIQTGIDNCLSISASISGTTLSWKLPTGNSDTLDHYTVYISTDGQNLAVLADGISPSTMSLDLSKYGIDSGKYTLYVKAVGKPSILNHMSNAVAYTSTSTSGGGSCTTQGFKGGAISATTVAPGGAYTVSCDYGFVGPGIAPTVGSGNCSYSKFNGTAAIFNCTAGKTAGTFSNQCVINSGNTQNYCTESNPLPSLTVQTVQTCNQPKFKAGSASPASVSEGGAYTVSCDYGFVGPGINPSVGSGNCTYVKFNGTAAIFNCTAGKTAGTFNNQCTIDSGNNQNLCTVSNSVNSVVVK